jgi:hypothetical protein
MTEGKTVRCVGNEVDQYGRLIAKCSTDQVPDIGVSSAGLAFSAQSFGNQSISKQAHLCRSLHYAALAEID